MGAPKSEAEVVTVTKDDVGELDILDPAQTPDSPGKDENKDGLPGGQTTANVPGDVLGI